MNCKHCFSLAVLSALLLGACGDGDGATPDAAITPGIDAGTPDATPAPAPDAASDATPGPPVFGGARPAELLVPPTYDPATPTPLVVALHGYAANNTYVTAVLGLDRLYQTAGFLLIAPHGTKDADGKYFWNATDACCNFGGDPVDDVAYINGLVDEVAAAYNVDAKRIYVVGHSNGGFMAHRLACASANRFAAIISVAGATFEDLAACTPSEKISVLQIHAPNDNTIKYAGGTIGEHAYPSAAGTTQRWAGLDGCADTTSTKSAMDLTSTAGDETDPVAFDGCPAGFGVELWTVNGSGHLIVVASGQPLWDWLSAHPKP